jgi:hypothetical protein|tara:strand:- start:111 stop:302 length:192 start_codon:yes stop_codon:yes gene_type:complete
MLDSGSKKAARNDYNNSKKLSQITRDPKNLLNEYVDRNQSGVSVNDQNVLVQQCKLKRQRFMF